MGNSDDFAECEVNKEVVQNEPVSVELNDDLAICKPAGFTGI
jgi:hypothetical protein